jgi:hypothetical protein
MIAIKNNFKRLTAAVFAVGLSLGLLGVSAWAQDVLQPQSQNGVNFVSGGVGEGSEDAIQNVGKQYDLHLLFAIQGSGQYLSDVNVTIKDAQGNALVMTVSDGPFFLAKLPPGKYRVSAESNGKSQTKSVDLSGGGKADLSFYWPANS